MSFAPDSLTLRQKLIEGDQLAKELHQHLDQGFLPKIQHLRRLTRPRTDASEEEVRDISIRTAVDDVMASDQYTRQFSSRLQHFLNAIEKDIVRIVQEG